MLLDSYQDSVLNKVDGRAWLIHFVENDVLDLELRKLPVLVSEVDVSEFFVATSYRRE